MFKNKLKFNVLFLQVTLLLLVNATWAQIQNTNVLNEPPDISEDFEGYRNTYYLANELASFNSETGQGAIQYLRYNFATRQAFNNMLSKLVAVDANVATPCTAVAP